MKHLCDRCLWVEVPPSCDNCRFRPDPEKKPPRGIKPQRIHDEQRMRELRACIARNMQGGYRVAPEWVREYNETLERLNRDDV